MPKTWTGQKTAKAYQAAAKGVRELAAEEQTAQRPFRHLIEYADRLEQQARGMDK